MRILAETKRLPLGDGLQVGGLFLDARKETMHSESHRGEHAEVALDSFGAAPASDVGQIESAITNPLNPDHLLSSVLPRMRKHDPAVFAGFWIAFGSELTRAEIGRLEWEHLIEREGVTWAIGRFGNHGQYVEVPIQPRAVVELEPLRQAAGPVLGPGSSKWEHNLRTMLRLEGHQSQTKHEELRRVIATTDLPPRTKVNRSVNHRRQQVRKNVREAESPISRSERTPTCPGGDTPTQQTGFVRVPLSGSKSANASRAREASDEPGTKLKKAAKSCLLQVKDVCAEVGFSRRFWVEEVKAGTVIGYRLGNRVAIDRSSIEAFLAERRIVAVDFRNGKGQS